MFSYLKEILCDYCGMFWIIYFFGAHSSVFGTGKMLHKRRYLEMHVKKPLPAGIFLK